MEQLDYSLLYRWFVGLSVDEPVWNASTFSKNRERLLERDIAQKLLEIVTERNIRRRSSKFAQSLLDAISYQRATLPSSAASRKERAAANRFGLLIMFSPSEFSAC